MRDSESDYDQYASQKAEARGFLEELRDFLEAWIPARAEVSKRVNEKIARASKNSKSVEGENYQSSPEGVFFNEFGIAGIHQFLVEKAGLTEIDACTALLSESYRHHRKMSSNSPRSKEKHPFTKKIGEKVESIADRWWGEGLHSAVSQSCPDLALRYPCPHSIVIEGKYFRNGGYQAAQSELVRNIYQCFFYRGLPNIPVVKTYPAWNYNYACLLAYDASDEGNLKIASDNVKKEVADALWKGANIYVMIVRGKD